MRYDGMSIGMWGLFAGSFRRQLSDVFGYDGDTAKAVMATAKKTYRTILAELPAFEKADRFKINLLSCAMLGAVILSIPRRPDAEQLTDYYAKAMMTPAMAGSAA